MRRLMHPQHGWHVITPGDNVEAMRKAGWVDDDGKALQAKLRPEVVAESTESAVKRGPGRPRKA